MKRKKSIERIERWDDFRIRKEQVVDEFVNVKKNQIRVTRWVQLFSVHQVISAIK